MEHHVLHRGSGYFFFHLSVGNTVSLKLMGFFSEKISFFQGNKKKKGTKGVDLGSQVIPRQNYFMCQIDYNTLFQVVKQKRVSGLTRITVQFPQPIILCIILSL